MNCVLGAYVYPAPGEVGGHFCWQIKGLFWLLYFLNYTQQGLAVESGSFIYLYTD